MNAVANGKVKIRSPFEKIYVQAAAGDAGGAIGAAMTIWNSLSGNRPKPMEHAYLGPKFSSDDINSIKIYTDNRYSVITQITAEDDFFAHSGSYSLEGDTYTEFFKLHTNPDMVGKSATFEYELKNKQLIISSDFMEEIWEKIE